MSFDYDSLQARKITWLYIVHWYVRTDTSNIHTVALNACKKQSFNFIQNCKIKRLLSTKWFLFYKVGKITLYLYSKVQKSIIIQYEPHCKPRSWLQKEWAFKKPLFCTSNVCLLPCDALFLRCIGVDGATFVGRSQVPFKSKRSQLQTKQTFQCNHSFSLSYLLLLTEYHIQSVYLYIWKNFKLSTINTLSSPYLLVVSLGLVIWKS